MNKKLELDKLRYDASKTFLMANASVIVAVTIGFWAVPESFKLTTIIMLTAFIISFITSAIIFKIYYTKLEKWYE